MRMTRYWMTGCMALIMLAGRAPQRDDAEDGHLRQRTRITLTSKYDVDETARQIERSARMSGLPVLVRTALPARDAAAQEEDHGAQVLVLGNEDGRTPVLQAEGRAVPHLPWQVTIRRLADGRAEVTLPDARGLPVPEGVDEQTMDRLNALPGLVEQRIT